MADTETMTVNVGAESAHRFRKTVKNVLGKGKGMLGKAATEAFGLWVREKELEVVRRRAIETLNKGFNMGKKLYKSRDELYDR